MNLNSERAKQYFSKHPIIGIYKGYEIRDHNGLFMCDASIGIYSMSSTDIEGCYEFIDELVNNDIKQYDDEKVMRYLINRDSLKNKV